MRVDDRADLSEKEAVVRLQEHVFLDQIGHLRQGFEEEVVLAVVKRVQQLLEAWHLPDDREDLRGVDHLLLQRDPVQRDDAGDDSVKDEHAVRKQLSRGECRDRTEEEIPGLCEVSRRHQVDSLVHLQLVLPFPVPSLLKKLLALFDQSPHHLEVPVKDRHDQLRKHHVKLVADSNSLLLSNLEMKVKRTKRENMKERIKVKRTLGGKGEEEQGI